MSETEYNNFYKKLAFYTAPTLLGIKCASLVSLSSDEFDLDFHTRNFNRRAASKSLKIKILQSGENKKLLLVYNEQLLKKHLAEYDVRCILKKFGYSECCSLDECLDCLSVRFSESGNFPHEIGIFLDYPVEDVIGFIRNKGGNFKLCGCWKVYGSEENARRKFANYNKCRKFLCGRLSEGDDIYKALKIS